MHIKFELGLNKVQDEILVKGIESKDFSSLSEDQQVLRWLAIQCLCEEMIDELATENVLDKIEYDGEVADEIEKLTKG
jgi:hypothetical protein